MERTFYTVIKYKYYDSEPPKIVNVSPTFDEASEYILELIKIEYQNHDTEDKLTLIAKLKNYYDIPNEKLTGTLGWNDLQSVIKNELRPDYIYCTGLNSDKFVIEEISIRVDQIVKEVLQDFMAEKY